MNQTTNNGAGRLPVVPAAHASCETCPVGRIAQIVEGVDQREAEEENTDEHRWKKTQMDTDKR